MALQSILKRKILVIDNNIDFAKYIQSLLKPHDIITYIATSSDQAIKIVQEKIPDCILIDYMLPFSTAISFTQKIKEDNLLKNIFIIHLTNNDTKEAHINALNAGADDFILNHHVRKKNKKYL